MGQKQDAEFLSVDNIEAVQMLDVDLDETEGPVVHVIRAPEGLSVHYIAVLRRRPSTTVHAAFIVLSN